MVWHTIQEAVSLTGRSRRSIYRDCNTGRVSYRTTNDGRREFETTELMRVYGALKGPEPAQDAAQSEPQPVTAPGTVAGEDITALISELRALREEVAELRQTMKLIEYKPDPVPPPATEPVTVPVSWWARMRARLKG
ncbi:hypothetical protein ACFZAC_26155 [Pseudomonas fluorescens]|uniref:hypothetical protein n=1 Tax=Pseudomonas fluorescens TaxID=294 RepID=UPI003747DD8A